MVGALLDVTYKIEKQCINNFLFFFLMKITILLHLLLNLSNLILKLCVTLRQTNK